MINLSHVTGNRPVIIVEGDTDRIFLEALRGVTPEFQEPDYIQLDGVGNLDETFTLFVKSPVFYSVPLVKIIIDSDNNDGRWDHLKSLLKSSKLEEHALSIVERSEYKPNSEDTIKVGAFLLQGSNEDSPDLEGLISDSISETSSVCRLSLEQSFINAIGYSKRLRFAERACSEYELRDVSYYSLYGQSSGINFNAPCFQTLKDFLVLD